jgi:nucleotide-binding universal stress UspA family protein
MNPTPSSDLPAPSVTRRDTDGRLTGVAFDSTPPPPTTAISPWLIAIDGSPHAQRAVAEALRLGHAIPDCAFHLVHVVHWLSKEAAETELARRAWETTRAVRRTLDDAGQPWRLHAAMGDSAEAIANVAGEQGCRGIVIGRRGLGSTSGLLLGSVSSKVIQHSAVPVLVIP